MKKVSIRPSAFEDAAHGGKPAARAIPAGGEGGKKSRFAQEQAQRFSLDLDTEQYATPKINVNPSFLRDIVEKPVAAKPVPPSFSSLPPATQSGSTGFPVATTRKPTEAPGKRFAVSTELDEESGEDDEVEEEAPKGDLDRETDAMLAKMSEEEILDEQAELARLLGPDMLAFIKKKAARDHPSSASTAPKGLAPEAHVERAELHESADSSSPEPHFTLSGTLIPQDSGHSHAGPSQTYTLPALLMLARSSLPAQRATAYIILLRLVERYLLSDRNETIAKVIIAHLDEAASLAVGALGIAEHSAGVLSSALLLLNAVAKLERGPLRPASPELVISLLGGLRRLLSERQLDRPRLEMALECLDSLAREAVLAPKICEMADLLEAVVEVFAAVPWPSKESPSPLAPIILRRLVGVSRETARGLLQRRAALLDPLLRYVVSPPYEAMLVETLKLWTAFARYGLASDLRVGAGLEKSLMDIEARASKLNEEDDEYGLAEAWYSVVGAWTACATDPHHTDPPHSILWTHVEGWDEPLRSDAERRCGVYLERGGETATLAANLDGLAIWLEGAAVNQSADRRELALNGFSTLFEDVRRLLDVTLADIEAADAERMDDRASLALAALRLLRHSALSTSPCDSARLDQLAAISPSLPLLNRLLASLAVGVSRWPIDRFFTTLGRLHAGDGQQGQRLALRCLSEAGVESDPFKLLKPFVISACAASSSVAPDRSQASTLPLVDTLRPSRRPLLEPNWPLACVLDELLGSDHSSVLRALPSEQANEATLLEAGLSAALTCWKVPEAKPQAEDILFEGMKVFMLEKDVVSSDPLYSQAPIAAHLHSLLALYSPSSPAPTSKLTLSSFPDFYNDFVELYAALSLGDSLFGRYLFALFHFSSGEPIKGCARILFHSHASLLRTITDDAIRGHPALEKQMQWSDDEIVQGAMEGALRSDELSPKRNGLLIELIRRQIRV